MRITKNQHYEYRHKGESQTTTTPVCDCEIIHQEVVDTALAEQPDPLKLLKLSELFKVIGDSTRIKILWALDNREMCVCDLANVLNMTKATTSYHLTVLREANLVKYEKRGKETYYTMQDEHVRDLYEIGIAHIAHYECHDEDEDETDDDTL